MKDSYLLELADKLDTLDPRLFDLSSWKNLRYYKSNECHTTFCAAGYAAECFPSLRLVVNKTGLHHTPTGTMGFLACAEAFGISISDALYLFSKSHYPSSHHSAKYVAARIRLFVKKSKKGKK